MYNILLLPIISGIIAQSAKFFFKANGEKFSFKNIISYAGMPSGHSAMVVSLATIILLEFGLSSPVFALSFVLAFVVIRDAIGIRRYLGQHGQTLNILVKDLGEDQLLDKSYPHLLEKIGHTPMQVLVGGLIGFFISILGYIFF
ncbi:MAG: divergent PAP2 family protein [Patescibacteria group bacterium]|nr:divergent PAP2 family protein [Patescibacteria group bacterium]MDD5294944.1 divergent PAP2 family protein [Patescibacteria group bacterium]MDD5554786.1 divergent PAP2 family protein [Patescibacteria group bacterium]